MSPLGPLHPAHQVQESPLVPVGKEQMKLLSRWMVAQRVPPALAAGAALARSLLAAAAPPGQEVKDQTAGHAKMCLPPMKTRRTATASSALLVPSRA